MAREILTYPLERRQVREELVHLINHLVTLGYQSCAVLFGAGWGNRYYPTNQWNEIDMDLDALMTEIEQVEAKGYGTLGRDDLFLRIHDLPVEFHFCNDSDIHVYLKESHPIAEALYQRWKALGYNPAEWTRSTNGPSTDRIRFN